MQIPIVFSPTWSPETHRRAEHFYEASRKDPLYAELLAAWLDDAKLGPTPFLATNAVIAACNLRSRPPWEAAILDAHAKLAGDLALIGLSIAGCFDPTPTSDGAGVAVSLAMTSHSAWYALDAFLFGLSSIPYAGNAVAKPFLVGRVMSRIEQARKVISAVAERAGPRVKQVLEKLTVAGDATHARPSPAMQLATFKAAMVARMETTVLDLLKFLNQSQDLLRLSESVYPNMERLRRYMAQPSRRIAVYWGDEGAQVIQRFDPGSPASGVFMPNSNPNGQLRAVLAFRGNPSTVTVHHELWHYRDFLKNFQGKASEFGAATTARLEEFVHKSLESSRRWSTYAARDRAEQESYILMLRHGDEFNKLMEKLGQKPLG